MRTLNGHVLARSPRTSRHHVSRTRPSGVANAYDHVGYEYRCYADGEGLEDPSAGTARFAHADAIVWETIRDTLHQLRAAGVRTLRVLDAGCGPGTWIRRIADYAQRLGLGIDATGFDISKGQLEIARKQIEKHKERDPGKHKKIRFLIHNLADPLPWAVGHFHIVLCNYVVLNHLPKAAIPGVVEELCRVAGYRVIATVRALASPATGCIIGTEQVSEYRQDCGRGELRLVLKDGTEHRLTFNLYSAELLGAMFAAHATIVDLRAVDLFLSRFAADANWTANLVGNLPGRTDVIRKLKEIEEPLCRLPGWVDHGTHVLIVAEPNHATTAMNQSRAPRQPDTSVRCPST